MGNCNSHHTIHPDDDNNQESLHNKQIEADLNESALVDRSSVKCVLLGAGECGKSTILKQMKILHLNGYNHNEKINYKYLIWKNTIEAMQILIKQCKHYNMNICDNNLYNNKLYAKLQNINLNDINTDNKDINIFELGKYIYMLWLDKTIQKIYDRHSEYYIPDSSKYFLDKSNITFTIDYIPDNDDILHTRIATTGIIETNFSIDNTYYKLYDVGGQRGERRKWIHCFDDVTSVMFIASLSEYDQTLVEDRTRNRLNESLDLFEGIVNLPWFIHTPIILFLNKNDIFMNKIKNIDLGIYHSEYVGGCNYQSALNYIQNQYFIRNKNKNKIIYCHVTDATNTNNIEFVWKATKHIILEQMVANNQLLI